MQNPDCRNAEAVLGALSSSQTGAFAHRSPLLSAFDRFASRITRWVGSPLAFAVALLSVVVWALLGQFFDYSEAWQLVINTGTTIITFLMVFLIQQSQNKDSTALHLKLDELISASKQASNRMIGIEALDEQDLRDVAEFYARLAALARERADTVEPESAER